MQPAIAQVYLQRSDWRCSQYERSEGKESTVKYKDQLWFSRLMGACVGSKTVEVPHPILNDAKIRG